MSTKKSYGERVLLIKKHADKSSDPSKVQQLLKFWDNIDSYRAEDQRKIKSMINQLYNSLPQEASKTEKARNQNAFDKRIEEIRKQRNCNYMQAKHQAQKEIEAETKRDQDKKLAELAARMEQRLKRVKPTGKTDLKRDAQREAQHPGKRKSITGKVYYENRRNRTDLDNRKDYPHL
jgi:hypothetical protein